jgi:hypothetical protein
VRYSNAWRTLATTSNLCKRSRPSAIPARGAGVCLRPLLAGPKVRPPGMPPSRMCAVRRGRGEFQMADRSMWKRGCAQGVPPHPRSSGIIDLGGKSRQVFGFKGLRGKVFRNKELGCQRALKWVWGSFRGPSWETGTLLAAPIRSLLSRTARWMSVTQVQSVCDEKVRGFRSSG